MGLGLARNYAGQGNDVVVLARDTTDHLKKLKSPLQR